MPGRSRPMAESANHRFTRLPLARTRGGGEAASSPREARLQRLHDLAEEAVPVAHRAERLQVGVGPDQGAEEEDLVPRGAEEAVLERELGHLAGARHDVVVARVEGRIALERL